MLESPGKKGYQLCNVSSCRSFRSPPLCGCDVAQPRWSRWGRQGAVVAEPPRAPRDWEAASNAEQPEGHWEAPGGKRTRKGGTSQPQ